jgi:hypothetical protein
MSFATPQLAAEALIKAAADYDVPALLNILGPDGRDLVSSEDPVGDKNAAAQAAAKAREKLAVVMDPKNAKRATFIVGNEDWPSPIPIVQKQGKWYFDTKAGRVGGSVAAHRRKTSSRPSTFAAALWKPRSNMRIVSMTTPA